MSGPWEQFAAPTTPPPAAGPWTQFGGADAAPAAPAKPVDRSRGAAAIPTAADEGIQMPAGPVTQTNPQAIEAGARAQRMRAAPPTFAQKVTGGVEAGLNLVATIVGGAIGAPLGVAGAIGEATGLKEPTGPGGKPVSLEGGMEQGMADVAGTLKRVTTGPMDLNAEPAKDSDVAAEIGDRVVEPAMAGMQPLIGHAGGVGNDFPAAKGVGQMAVDRLRASPGADARAAVRVQKAKIEKPVLKGIADANKAGFTLPPSETKQGGATGAAANVTESLSGDAAFAKSASKKNAEVTNKLAREDIGLEPDEPLTRESVARVRSKAGEKYAVLKQIDEIDNDRQYHADLDAITEAYDTAAKVFPHRSENPFQKVIDGLRQDKMTGAAAIEEVKLLRADADKAYGQGDKGLGKAFRKAADALDNSIDRHLTKMVDQGGDPKLATAVADYRAARKTIAKTYLLDSALNETTGNVDAARYARALDKAPGKMDGPGLTIAKAAKQFPRVFQKPERIGNAGGPTAIDAALSLLGGKLDVATLGGRPAARAVLGSKPVQRMLTKRARDASKDEPKKPPKPPEDPTTSPGASDGGGGGGGGGVPPRGPLGDLTPDWETTPGAGGGKPRGGHEPGLVRSVDETEPLPQGVAEQPGSRIPVHEPKPLGDLTPEWDTTPGAGGPRGGGGGGEPGLVRSVDDERQPAGKRAEKLQIPAVPGRPDLPDTVVAGSPSELALDKRTQDAMGEPGAIEARRVQAEAAERARRADEPRVPIGETKEGQPEIKPGKTGKIPVGKATEGQPEIKPFVPKKPIPKGEATELPVERIEPKEPIPEGEVVDLTPEQEAAWRKEFGLGDGDAERAKAVAAALRHDAPAVEKAAVQHDNSPRAFDREIARITEEGEARANEGKQAADGSEGDAPKQDGAATTAAAGERAGADSPAAAGGGGEQAPAGRQAADGPLGPFKSREADREAKRLTDEGSPHTAVQRERVDDEGYTVSEWFVEPVAAKKGLTLEEAKAHLAQANIDRPMGGSWEDIQRRQGGKLDMKGVAPSATGVEIREVPGGFEAYRDGKKVGYLKDNLERGQAKQLGENANVDMVKVDKDEQGKGTGRALYAAFEQKHEGAIMPSGKTEPSAWKLWKRNYPEKVDAFVKQEAERIKGGADSKLVAGNITDPEVRSRVLKEAETKPAAAPKSLEVRAAEDRIKFLQQRADYFDQGGPEQKTFADGLRAEIAEIEKGLGREALDNAAAGISDQSVIAGADRPRSAAAWANDMEELRKVKPRPLDKLFGKNGPTPAQRATWDAQMKKWNADYRKASAEQKKALERDNAAHRAAQEAPDAQRLQPDPVRPAADAEGAKKGGDAEEIFSTEKAKEAVETPEFKAWFGDSKVVDDGGKPRVMYHGTNPWEKDGFTFGDVKAFDRFMTHKVFGRESLDQVGSWFSDNPGKGGAAMYGDTLYPVYLAIKNPWTVTFEGLWRQAQKRSGQPLDARPNAKSVAALDKWMDDNDIDGIHIKHDPHSVSQSTEFAEQDVWVARKPEQIKSSIGNRGTFDATDPNLLHKQQVDDYKAGRPAGKPVGSPEKMREVLADKFGAKLVDGLIDQGILKFALALDEGMTRDKGMQDVRAMFRKKPGEQAAATLYFDRIVPENAPAILMHELGEHFGAPRLLGQDRYNLVMGELKELAKSEPEVKAAWDHVVHNYIGEGTPNKVKLGDEMFMREVAAHLVETQPDLPWVRRMINEIRAFFYEHFGTTMGNRVDADLIRGLAAAALRKASTGGLAGQTPAPRQFKSFVPSSRPK